MDSLSIEKLGEELTCAVCLDILNKPVSLPCGHNVCFECLRGLVESVSSDEPRCWCRQLLPAPPYEINRQLSAVVQLLSKKEDVSRPPSIQFRTPPKEEPRPSASPLLRINVPENLAVRSTRLPQASFLHSDDSRLQHRPSPGLRRRGRLRIRSSPHWRGRGARRSEPSGSQRPPIAIQSTSLSPSTALTNPSTPNRVLSPSLPAMVCFSLHGQVFRVKRDGLWRYPDSLLYIFSQAASGAGLLRGTSPKPLELPDLGIAVEQMHDMVDWLNDGRLPESWKQRDQLAKDSLSLGLLDLQEECRWKVDDTIREAQIRVLGVDARDEETISLEQKDLKEHGGRLLAMLLHDNPHVRRVFLNYCIGLDVQYIALDLESNATLHSLSFTYCGLRSSNGERLINALETNGGLRMLNLHGNEELGDASAWAVSQVLRSNQSLKTLVLSECGITEDGVRGIAAMLTVNHALHHLDLRGNAVGDDGMGDIAASLSVNTGIEVLMMGGRSVQRRGWMALLHAVGESPHANRTVRKMVLEECTIGEVRRECDRLRRSRAVGCEFVL